MRRLICILLLSFAFLTTFAFPSYAPISSYTFNVNTFADYVDGTVGDGICDDGSGRCSLRAAIMEANASSPVNVTINVPAGTYNLTRAYGAEEDASLWNDLDITNTGSTIITGTGTGQSVIINASAIADRAFDVFSGAKLYLNNLTITGGYSSVGGGGIRVNSGGTLNLDHVIITGNQSVYGGGIYNAGIITGTMVSITSNTVSGSNSSGGGIYLTGNTNNSVTLSRSLIAGNSAFMGGGIYNGGNGNYTPPVVGGNLRLDNVTISGNTATDSCGAGILLSQGSSAYFVNCTIANNTNSNPSSGAGVCGNGANAFAFLNTLVVNNRYSGIVNNCYQISSSSLGWRSLNPAYFDMGVPFGHDMSDDSSCNSFTTSSNTLLETSLTTSTSLAGVGTYKLQAGSAAIDAGDPANYPIVDVFGTARPQGTAPDIGAHEFSDDTTPDPFTFTAQTGVGLNATVTSNTITVSGINAPAAISITGGTYKINSGSYTSASGTVNNNDTVTVQQTSSGSYSSTTNATLTIGGVSDTFSVTTTSTPPPGAGNRPGCFIATAAFGSPLAGQVEILRQFRDRYLLTNALGQKFVSWYYRNGPVAANFIKDKPLAKAAVRLALYPLIGFSFLLISGYLPFMTVGLLISALLFLRFRQKKLGAM